MKNIILLLALSLLALSCAKYPKKKIVYIPIDTWLLEHYDFNAGTYWIYKDSATGNEDSFVITNRVIDTVLRQYSYSSEDEQRQMVSMAIRQYHNNVMYDTIGWSMTLQNHGVQFGNGISTGSQSQMASGKSVEITQVTIQGIFYDVRVGEYLDGFGYFKDDVGPLKFNFNNNIMEVLRYRILQH